MPGMVEAPWRISTVNEMFTSSRDRVTAAFNKIRELGKQRFKYFHCLMHLNSPEHHYVENIARDLCLQIVIDESAAGSTELQMARNYLDFNCFFEFGVMDYLCLCPTFPGYDVCKHVILATIPHRGIQFSTCAVTTSIPGRRRPGRYAIPPKALQRMNAEQSPSL